VAELLERGAGELVFPAPAAGKPRVCADSREGAEIGIIEQRLRRTVHDRGDGRDAEAVAESGCSLERLAQRERLGRAA